MKSAKDARFFWHSSWQSSFANNAKKMLATLAFLATFDHEEIVARRAATRSKSRQYLTLPIRDKRGRKQKNALPIPVAAGN